MKQILLAFSLFWVWSCSNDLPRASSDELPCDVSRFDQVFYDVWGMGTNTLDGLMVVKDGKVIYEKYETGHGPDNLHALWSVSKTFTATAVGFAQQDGLLSVDDKVLDFFEEEKPAEPSEWLKQMTIKDLLIMSSGFKDDFIGRSRNGLDWDWAKETLASPVMFEPGTMFHYNSMNTYLLSVIVSKVTGIGLDEYLNKKLFKPLGIKNWEWKTSPQGYTAGGWGLYLTLESMAKMGQFFLNRGTWNGKRLLNEAWFDEAMRPQILQYQGRISMEEAVERYKYDEWHQGYGYQMWMCTHGAVRLDGAWGQYVIIVPDKNLVVACQSYNPNGMRCIQSIWNNIYDLLYVYQLPEALPNSSNFSFSKFIEAESLNPVFISETLHLDRQDMAGFSDGVWSGAKQLVFYGGKKGDSAVLKIDNLEKGRYIVSIYATMAADYGIAQIRLNGGKPFYLDCWYPSVVNAGSQVVGQVDVQDIIEMEITVHGQNPKSKSNMLGIDRIVLNKVNE